MRKTANGRRIYALADYTVERTHRGWYFGRTSRFGDIHAMKGPHSSERSVAQLSGARSWENCANTQCLRCCRSSQRSMVLVSI